MENFNKLKKTLTENNINYHEVSISNLRDVEEGIIVEIPMAREKIELFFKSNDENMEKILNSKFFKCRGIQNYEAIWSPELRFIECEILQANTNIPSIFLLKRLQHIFSYQLENTDEISYEENMIDIKVSKFKGIDITIGGCSLEFGVISMYKEGRVRDLEKLYKYRITLKIRNVDVESHDMALQLLEKISNSIFFQIDLIFEYPILLGPQRENRNLMRNRVKPRINSNEYMELSFNQEYDNIPLSLYWFGKTSYNLPIFQYLAYYQALEYYFPLYSFSDAKNRIRNLIKDPRFNIFNDSDIVRLLDLIKVNKLGGIGDEKEQLITTLKAVLNYDNIYKFICEDEGRKNYFESKKSLKISSEKLQLKDKTGLVSKLSKRIYDIRCKIVHNKASQIDNKLMPFSNEVKYLRYDIDLLEFVVRKVIISNSRELTL